MAFLTVLGGLVALVVAGNAGCGGHSHAAGEGKPTGAECPTTQTLTYTSFGKGFVDQFCQRCHAEAVTGAARNGAPDDHTFDTLVDIKVLGEHMDEWAGAGPDSVNTGMPPSGPAPTLVQRKQFSEWIACGAP